MLGILLVVAVGLGFMSYLCMGAETNCSKTLGDATFEKCSYFAALDATLSWTYYPANGSMDLGFKAKPAAPRGWVGWGINPTSSGMVGTQALIGFQLANGSMVAMTYNVSSKMVGSIPPSNISYSAHKLRSTFEGGAITVFATVVLPSNKSMVNHTWQVGGAVEGFSVERHAFANDNLMSYGPLDLITAGTAPAGSPSANAPTAGGSGKAPPPSSPSPPSSSTKAHPYHAALLSFLFLLISLCMFAR